MDETYKTRPVLWSADFIRICLANFTAFTSLYFIMPTLPLYVKQLGGTEAVVGLVVGIFTFSAVAIRVVIGRALDEWGRRSIYLGALGILSIAAIGYQWAGTVAGLLAVRVLYGFGWGASHTAAGTVAADIIPASRRGEGMGFFGLSNTLAMTIGPAAGVFIGVEWGFPILFNLAGLCALIGLALAYSIRYRPVQVAAGTRGSFIEPAALPFAAISFCCTTIYGGIVAFMTLYALEQGINNPGVYFSVFAVAVIVARPIAGRLYDRSGMRVVMAPGLLLVTLSMLILGVSHHPVLFLVSGVFMGLGFGATQPTLQAMVITVVDPQRRGTATATLTLGADFGIGTGAMLLGLIAQTVGYATMYLYSTVGGIIALILYFWYEHHTVSSDESGVRVDDQ